MIVMEERFFDTIKRYMLPIGESERVIESN